MSGFENPDSAYADGTDDSQAKRRDAAARKKDTRKDRKDKGYIMFDEEDSEEELVGDDVTKSPTKVKKHVKPFKFVKKDKAPKPKEKEKEKDEKKEKDRKEKDKKDKVDKVDKEKEKVKEKTEKTEKKEKVEKVEKERKEKVEKEPKEEVRWRTKKKFMPVTVEEEVSESLKPVFGVPLLVAIERSPCHDGIQLPVVVRECIDYIEEFGLLSEGIYRISGVKSKVQALKDAYNKGVPVYLHDHEPNDIASLLKQFFRDLPEPVLTAKLMPKFEQASTIKAVKEKVEQFELLLKELPPTNKILLSWMIVHMTHVISREKQNKMTLQNVSIVLSPTMQISHRVLNIFFGFSKILFKDTIIKRYVPPLKPVSSRWSLELPDSPSAIEEELKKQESLLNHLHEELMTVKDMGKEEQLWEVQRVVTQLKRKLKNAKQVQMSNELAKRREDDILKEKIERGQQQLKQLNIADMRSTGKEKLKTVEEIPVPVEPEPECEESKPGDMVVKQIDEPTGEAVVEHRKSSEIAEEKVSTEAEQEKPETADHEKPAAELSATTDQSAVETEVKTVGVNVATDEDKGTTTVSSVEDAAAAETDNLDASIPVSSESEVIAVETAVTEEVQHVIILAGSGDHIDTESKGTDEVTDEVASVTNTEPPKETSLSLDKPLTDISADARKSPSEDSSDAYTDVLEEDETDHLSDILEKDIKLDNPPDVEYTELCEDSSAAMEVPGRAEAADQTDKELESALDDSHLEESEHDERQYSERTTSSEPSEFEEDDEEHRALEQENIQLMMEEEELLAIGDELRQKIRTEKREIERLHQDIAELQMIREEMYESDDSSSSSDESDDGDDLREILQQLIRDNEDLELENADLCDKIHQERQICIAVKVQNRMMQQRNLELSGYGIEDRESLL